MNILQDTIIHLGSYGFLIRTIVAGVREYWKGATEKQIKTLVFVVAGVFVYAMGVHPMGALKLDAVLYSPVRSVVEVLLLAGAAMTTHDVLDFIKRMGEKK